MEIANLKYGFIKLNTTYIPKFLYKEKLTDGQKSVKNVYIKSKIPLLIMLGGIEYTLDYGEHYIPQIHTFHHFKILTDLTNNEECEVYHKCLVDDNYYKPLLIMLMNQVLVNSIHPKNDNEYTLFMSGMVGSITYEKLYNQNLNENNIKLNFSWLFNNNFFYGCKEQNEEEKIKQYNEIVLKIKEWNNNIIKYENMDIIEFVSLSEIPFTMEFYEKLRKQKYDNDDKLKNILVKYD